MAETKLKRRAMIMMNGEEKLEVIKDRKQR